MPPLVLAALGALGATALARLLVRETRRVNRSLDPHRPNPDGEPPGETLERDPETGAYRPRRRA
ncbi:hypothetical protein [Aquabacter spiritensis]|uniref:Uncharacterized protein n=1 Tax=Aquabacter spiritensis TaxID=933073 RepID=A0A4R3M4N7_9HYPH|nr:hypothetical protein [Aquabacter spiritensis]TCT08220.1 hypothetical protein EDC64_101742 [Aquabacter spiritensis]